MSSSSYAKTDVPSQYNLKLRIKMETRPGQSMSIVGSLNQLGRWKDFRVGGMKWSEGHIWEMTLNLSS